MIAAETMPIDVNSHERLHRRNLGARARALALIAIKSRGATAEASHCSRRASRRAHLFEESGALDAVIRLAIGWCRTHLGADAGATAG
jgi:hypothetical protein